MQWDTGLQFYYASSLQSNTPTKYQYPTIQYHKTTEITLLCGQIKNLKEKNLQAYLKYLKTIDVEHSQGFPLAVAPDPDAVVDSLN